MLKKHPNIYEVNEFLYNSTYYKYFAFNGRIFKVMIPEDYGYEKSKTELTVRHLEQGEI